MMKNKTISASYLKHVTIVLAITLNFLSCASVRLSNTQSSIYYEGTKKAFIKKCQEKQRASNSNIYNGQVERALFDYVNTRKRRSIIHGTFDAFSTLRLKFGSNSAWDKISTELKEVKDSFGNIFDRIQYFVSEYKELTVPSIFNFRNTYPTFKKARYSIACIEFMNNKNSTNLEEWNSLNVKTRSDFKLFVDTALSEKKSNKSCFNPLQSCRCHECEHEKRLKGDFKKVKLLGSGVFIGGMTYLGIGALAGGAVAIPGGVAAGGAVIAGGLLRAGYKAFRRRDLQDETGCLYGAFFNYCKALRRELLCKRISCRKEDDDKLIYIKISF